MMNVFIDKTDKVWVLNALTEEYVDKPSPKDWIEMPSSRPSSGVFSRDRTRSAGSSASVTPLASPATPATSNAGGATAIDANAGAEASEGSVPFGRVSPVLRGQAPTAPTHQGKQLVPFPTEDIPQFVESAPTSSQPTGSRPHT